MCVDTAPVQSTDNSSITLDRIVTVFGRGIACNKLSSHTKVNEADTRGIRRTKQDIFWFNIAMNNAMRVKVL